MAAGPERLRELVEHAARASNPEASLRALAALRAEIDEVERETAARALAVGSSFGAIARALGISRQAAHRRYRTLAGAGAPPEPEPQRRVLITSEARTAVRYAREEATALGFRAVGSEHLLLGVLRCTRSPVTHALRDLGADLATARERVMPTVEAEAPGTGGTATQTPRGISNYAKRVFDQSLREATSRGDGYVGVEHLVLAALQDSDGGAVRTLEALGVSREAVVARLEAGPSSPASP